MNFEVTKIFTDFLFGFEESHRIFKEALTRGRIRDLNREQKRDRQRTESRKLVQLGYRTLQESSQV